MANSSKMAQCRRFTKTEMQSLFRHYSVTEQDGEFWLYPTNRRTQGDEVLLYPSEAPVTRCGTLIDLTTTWMVNPAELEDIFQWKFNGQWALVRLGELFWPEPELAAFRLVEPLEATHMQVQILWNQGRAGRLAPFDRKERPHWLCHSYRYTCENEPQQGSDFYLIDLTDPFCERLTELDELRLQLAIDYDERMKVGGKSWKK